MEVLGRASKERVMNENLKKENRAASVVLKKNKPSMDSAHCRHLSSVNILNCLIEG